jgi:hypothetical protein
MTKSSNYEKTIIKVRLMTWIYKTWCVNLFIHMKFNGVRPNIVLHCKRNFEKTKELILISKKLFNFVSN